MHQMHNLLPEHMQAFQLVLPPERRRQLTHTRVVVSLSH